MPQPLTFSRTTLLAATLLAAYVGQALSLVIALPMSGEESRTAFAGGYFLVIVGTHRTLPTGPMWPDDTRSFDRSVAPVMMWIARIVPWRHLPGNPKLWLRMPMVLIGLLLLISIWTIARRWYGVAGGMIALALCSFSLSLVEAGARLEPEILAAWAVFGAIFTAMATAHSTYAAPGSLSVSRRWNNVPLFALALGIGMAALPSFLVPFAGGLAICLALYLAGGNRARLWNMARLLLFGIAMAAALVLLIYDFQVHELRLRVLTVTMTGGPLRWHDLLLPNMWPLLALLAISFFTWLSQRRHRWFGATAPLIAALLALATGHPAVAAPFLALFIAGVFSDLLETRFRRLWQATVVALLAAYAGLSLWLLRQI